MKRILLIILFIPVAAAAAWGTSFLRDRLTPSPSLSITSTPSASVYLNGAYRGVAPLHIPDLAKGSYALRFSREGYQDLRQSVTVADHAKLSVTLEPRPRSSLLITSVPEGAAIYIDGVRQGRTPMKLEDVTPGAHNVELMLPNYLASTQTVTLGEGAEENLAFELEHRQVRVYRMRIKADTYDIGAYNDLGELLFVLERYEEAAQVYVDGYIAAGSGHKLSGRGGGREAGRLSNEPRSRHGHADFIKALDHAIFAALTKGEKSNVLMADFTRIPWSNYPKAYAASLEGLMTKNTKDAKLAVKVAKFFRNMNRFDRAIELLDQAITNQPKDFTTVMAATDIMLDVLEGRKDDKASKALDRYIGKASGLATKEPKTTILFFAQGRRHIIRGDFDEGASRCREAIGRQKQVPKANSWRLYLARECRKAKKLPECATLLHDIIATKQTRTTQVRQAQQLLRALPKELRKRKK